MTDPPPREEWKQKKQELEQRIQELEEKKKQTEALIAEANRSHSHAWKPRLIALALSYAEELAQLRRQLVMLDAAQQQQQREQHHYKKIKIVAGLVAGFVLLALLSSFGSYLEGRFHTPAPSGGFLPLDVLGEVLFSSSKTLTAYFVGPPLSAEESDNSLPSPAVVNESGNATASLE